MNMLLRGRRGGRWLRLRTPRPPPPPPCAAPPRCYVCLTSTGFFLFFLFFSCSGASSRNRHVALQPTCPVSNPQTGWHPASKGDADARRGGRRSRDGWRLLAEPPSLRECAERSDEDEVRNDRVVAKGVAATRRDPRIGARQQFTKAQRPAERARTQSLFTSFHLQLCIGRTSYITLCPPHTVAPHLHPSFPRGASVVLDAACRDLPPDCALANQGPHGTIT